MIQEDKDVPTIRINSTDDFDKKSATIKILHPSKVSSLEVPHVGTVENTLVTGSPNFQHKLQGNDLESYSPYLLPLFNNSICITQSI